MNCENLHKKKRDKNAPLKCRTNADEWAEDLSESKGRKKVFSALLKRLTFLSPRSLSPCTVGGYGSVPARKILKVLYGALNPFHVRILKTVRLLPGKLLRVSIVHVMTHTAHTRCTGQGQRGKEIRLWCVSKLVVIFKSNDWSNLWVKWG